MINSQKKTSLREYNNNQYHPQASALKCIAWYFINVLFFINPLFPFVKSKIFLLRLFGTTVGEGVVIKPNVNIKYPWFLEIGSYVWIGEGVWIDNLANVKLYDNVTLSQGAMLLTGNHNYKKQSFDLIAKGIVLEDGVWIGAKALVCPGVVCRSHSILTAGSVAVTNLEAYTIFQGNPALPKRDRKID